MTSIGGHRGDRHAPFNPPTNAPGAGRVTAAHLRAARRLALDDALSEVVPCLTELSVRSLVIKGPSFAWWLYDDPSKRSYGDIDLLVDPESFDAARGGLTGLGFEQLLTGTNGHESDSHHEVWVRRTGAPAKLELHHTVFPIAAARGLVWRRLSEGARSIDVGGVAIEIPSDPVCALIAGLHAAQHGVHEARPMRDLRLAVERAELPTWQAAAALADELGAAPTFVAGLRLDPRGGHLVARLGLGAIRPSRGDRLRAGTAPETPVSANYLSAPPARYQGLGQGAAEKATP